MLLEKGALASTEWLSTFFYGANLAQDRSLCIPGIASSVSLPFAPAAYTLPKYMGFLVASANSLGSVDGDSVTVTPYNILGVTVATPPSALGRACAYALHDAQNTDHSGLTTEAADLKQEEERLVVEGACQIILDPVPRCWYHKETGFPDWYGSPLKCAGEYALEQLRDWRALLAGPLAGMVSEPKPRPKCAPETPETPKLFGTSVIYRVMGVWSYITGVPKHIPSPVTEPSKDPVFPPANDDAGRDVRQHASPQATPVEVSDSSSVVEADVSNVPMDEPAFPKDKVEPSQDAVSKARPVEVPDSSNVVEADVSNVPINKPASPQEKVKPSQDTIPEAPPVEDTTEPIQGSSSAAVIPDDNAVGTSDKEAGKTGEAEDTQRRGTHDRTWEPMPRTEFQPAELDGSATTTSDGSSAKGAIPAASDNMPTVPQTVNPTWFVAVYMSATQGLSNGHSSHGVATDGSSSSDGSDSESTLVTKRETTKRKMIKTSRKVKVKPSNKAKDEKIKLDGGEVEKSKAEEVKLDEGKLEKSKIKNPKVQKSKAEDSKAEKTKLDEGKIEKSKVKKFKVQKSKAEGSKAENSKAEKPRLEKSKVQKSKAEDSNAKIATPRETCDCCHLCNL